MARMTERELLGAIQNERVHAEGGNFGADQLARFREEAWDYYLLRTNSSIPSLSDSEGVSTMKDSSVHDGINATLAAVMPSFASDTPAMFEPTGQNDEQQAELESRVVGKAIMDDNHGFVGLYCAVKSALMMKIGVMKVWVEERQEQRVNPLGKLSPEDAALAGATVGPDGNAEQVEDVTVRELLVEPVDITRFSYRKGWNKPSLDGCPFIEEAKEYTRTELIDMGYSPTKVARLKGGGLSTNTQELARNLDKQQGPVNVNRKDADIIRVYETYIIIDMNKGSRGRLWRIVSGGDGDHSAILEKTQVEFQPYAIGTPYLRPHSVSGESLTEKLRPIQDAKTSALRSYLDNMTTANHVRVAYTGAVDEDDLSDSGPNMHVRIDGVQDVRQAIMALPLLDIGSPAQSLLNYLDSVTSRRIGAVNDLQSAESQLLKSQIGSMGADRVLSEQEMMSSLVTRTLGETLIRQLVLLVHRALRRQFKQPLEVKLSGQWVTVDPSTWRDRSRLNVKTGMSAGERNRKVANLGAALSTSMSLLQSGIPLANAQTLHKQLSDWAAAAELDGAEAYWLDPTSQEFNLAIQQQQAAQDQQAQMMAQLQKFPDEVKMMIAQLQDRTKRLEIAVDAELEEAKLTVDGIDKQQQRQLDAATAAASNGQSASAGN